jgi:hypothetical protein
VTIADLRSVPDPITNAASSRRFSYTLLAVIPILASVGACVACGIFHDWYCFSMILLGMFSSGTACFVIGSGTLIFTRPDSAKGSPRGDGYLSGSSELVALRGAEGAVSAVTRGRFSLRFEGEPEYRAIGISAMLLMTQFLLQLLLIPQGTLFGQIMFLSTLAISWLYNCYLSSLDHEMIQAEILGEKVLKHPVMKRYQLGSWTAAVVFLVLLLRPPNSSDILDGLLPGSAMWTVWKLAVAEKIERGEQLLFDESDYAGVASDQRDLLKVLFSDATEAYRGYLASDIDMNEGRAIVQSKDSDLVGQPVMYW